MSDIYTGGTIEGASIITEDRSIVFPNKPFPTSYPKPFKLGFMLGRFQHVHLGHEMLIRKAASVCDTVIVLIGSAQEKGTLRNPFDIERRTALMSKVFSNDKNIIISSIKDYSHEDDHCPEWSTFLLNRLMEIIDHNQLTANPDLFIYGNDEERSSWFDSDHGFSKLIITRGDIDISATKLREYLIKGNAFQWRKYVNPVIYNQFNALRTQLLEYDVYKEMLNND